MTARDRTALVLIAAGAVAAVVAAYGYGGWRAAVVAVAVLALSLGGLLAYGDDAPPVVEDPGAAADDETDGAEERWQVYEIKPDDLPGGIVG